MRINLQALSKYAPVTKAILLGDETSPLRTITLTVVAPKETVMTVAEAFPNEVAFGVAAGINTVVFTATGEVKLTVGSLVYLHTEELEKLRYTIPAEADVSYVRLAPDDDDPMDRMLMDRLMARMERVAAARSHVQRQAAAYEARMGVLSELSEADNAEAINGDGPAAPDYGQQPIVDGGPAETGTDNTPE